MDYHLQGVITALVTPLTPSEEIDFEGVERLVNFLIVRGVDGLMAAGTTGEGPLLRLDERKRLAEMVVQVAAGRVPVIIHTGSISTAETVALTRHAAQIGAQAASVIPPYYYKYSDESLYRHYHAVASSTPDFPIYFYNYPAVANNELNYELVSRLVEECPNLVGIKDSTEEGGLLHWMQRLKGGAFNTINGNDRLILTNLSQSIHACVSGNSNLVPEIVVGLVRAIRAGQAEKAQALQEQLNTVSTLLHKGSYLATLKAVMARRGMIGPAARSPMLPAAPEDISACWLEIQKNMS